MGSGTGIFSEQLLKNGYIVYAVEPNDDMRKKAEEKLSKEKGFFSVKGTDKNTTLFEKSVDFITAAQSFHWFDADAFKKECKRILKPNGKVMIVYNNRDKSALCNKALFDILSKYCPEFKGFSGGMSDEKCRAFFNGKCEVFKVDNSQIYDRQGYIDRVLSSSYSLCEKDEEYGEYLENIKAHFNTFSEKGLLTVPIYTTAYIGSIE